MAFRQNLVNSHLASAIEFEHKLMLKEIDVLNKKISALEQKLKDIESKR